MPVYLPEHTNTTRTHVPHTHTPYTLKSRPKYICTTYTALALETMSIRTRPFQLCSAPCLIVSSVVYHCRKATWSAILLQACNSPTRIISPSLPACHASPCLSPTEQLSCLTKLSLTHPTSSLPSSHHHLAILHFHRRNNLHLHPV